MFRSLRWQLIISYVLLTLLAVSLVGVLGLSLVRRTAVRQEIENLTANAQAVAQQAQPLLRGLVREDRLQQLARTSSFLGNVRVRILDERRRVVADSGAALAEQDLVWVLPPEEWRFESNSGSPLPLIIGWAYGDRVGFVVPAGEGLAALQDLPLGTALTRVRRLQDLWGTRFHMEDMMERHMVAPEVAPAAGATVEAVAQQFVFEEASAHRSERVVTVPVKDSETLVGYVELSGALDFRSAALRTMRRALVLAAGGAMLAALVLGLVMSQRLSAPLLQLRAVAGRMTGGDLSTRAPVDRRDEIGQLARQFNEMAERLETSFAALAAERDALRRFIADASHELRTPITALRNFVELLRGPAARDAEAQSEFLAESQIQIDRLEWITRHLLDLSRLDAGLVNLELGQHDVGELVAAAASGFQERAREQSVQFVMQMPSPAVVCQCDRARIELALSNLLDNALKFTSAGGRVEIGGAASDDFLQLWVQDTGGGIDPQDQPRIFERFYRGRNGTAQGSGLGLAIVRSIVDAHGGQVTVESTPGAGSRFVIELPLRPPAA